MMKKKAFNHAKIDRAGFNAAMSGHPCPGGGRSGFNLMVKSHPLRSGKGFCLLHCKR